MTRFDGVQVLRFLAAFLVVVTHATSATFERLDSPVSPWSWGGVGVDIFFVISGFVMIVSSQGLLGRPDGWRFFAMRRIVRIVPIYWIATSAKLLAMFAVPAVVLHAQWDPVKTLLSYLFLPSRNVDGNVFPVHSVGWTLTFEMAFYTIFALALFLRANPLVFSGVILSSLALATLLRPEGNEWPAALFYLDPIVLYFLVGMVIGQWALDRRGGRLALGLSAVNVLWIVIDVADHGFVSFSLLLTRLLITVGVLSVVAAEPLLAGRVPQPLLFMGDASYSLYLFHPFVVPLLPVVFGFLGITNGTLSVIVGVIMGCLAAVPIYALIERPITRFLHATLPYMRATPRST